MKKRIIKKCIGLLLSVSIISSNIFVYNIMANDNNENIQRMEQETTVSIIENKGWHESAYVKWNPFKNADSYNVYCKAVGTDNFVKIDDSLIREYENYFIADALGLAAGNYTLKVVPVANGKEIESSASETEELSVDNYVREGFAFSSNSPYGYTTGAYNKDGTIKENADIVYITNSNKDNVTINEDTSLGVGLTEILSKREKSKSEKPLAIRFLGKVEMPKGTINFMAAIQNTKNVTIEGVGDDAVIHGYGFTTKRACNLEFRNFAIMWYGGGGDGDSISLDTENKNVWIHNIDFFYGFGKDADQAKGDGSIDLKAKSDYVTVSYCHFWDSGKALVLGGPWEVSNYTKPEAKIFATYHHNWFDHSDSRHPRCVSGSAHVYNNYYDGVAKYGPGAAVHSSVFVENNYFRNCPRPMLIATQGSDVYDSTTGKYTTKGTLSGQDGGMIKEYGNVIIGSKRFYTYQTTPDTGHFDAYTAENREEKVPENVSALKGGSVYNNFDTDKSVIYDYNVQTAEEAKDTVVKEAGRRNGGDFKYAFDNAVQDTNSAVIPELQNAVKNYESKLISVQGISKVPEEEETESTTANKPNESETTVSKTLFGDSDNNGDINVNDAASLLEKVLNANHHLPIEKVEDYEKYLDVDMNGILSATDASIILQKALNNDFIMPVEANTEKNTNTGAEESTEKNTNTGAEESTEKNTFEENTENTTETPAVLTDEWNADKEIPNWLDITGCIIGGASNSHTVFRDTDSSITSQKSRYTVPKSSIITINLSSASVVKMYIAGNNNGDGKGNATAELDGANIGTYSMPGRQTSAAEPFVITTEKGGILKITNSYEGLLYKITISGDSKVPAEPVIKEKYDVTLKITNTTDKAANLTVGENTFDVLANNITEKVIKLETGKYSIAVTGTKLKTNPSLISISGQQIVEITVEEISENVIVSDENGGYIGGYETISNAIAAESTVNGSIISVKPGYYKETFDVTKSITLQKAEDEDGEVVIYSPGGPYGGSMDGIVQVSSSNVTFKNLTLLNNTQSSYKEISAASTAGNTAAALVANGDNGVYDNCKFISVQDTLVTRGWSKGKPLLKQKYNNCTFYGATDFICGSGDIAFNNCEFKFFTGSLKEKIDAYIFAPDTDAKWVVNGGSITKDENSIAQNLFYARAWEAHSSDTQTLDIFGAENNLQMATSKGLMGFGSSTGGGKPHHNIHEFKFNVYEGNDKNSPLIATSDILGIDIFEVNENSPVIEFKNNSSANLIIGDFGKGLSNKFIQNILPDIVEIGFVSEINANTESISDTNTIKITSIYKKFTTDENFKYSLSSLPDETNGSFFGSGVLNGIDGEKIVKLVPYVKYDPITDSKKEGSGVDESGNAIPVDKDYIYKFGKPVEVTLKGSGEAKNNANVKDKFKILENGVFGESLPNGIGENNYLNMF